MMIREKQSSNGQFSLSGCCTKWRGSAKRYAATHGKITGVKTCYLFLRNVYARQSETNANTKWPLLNLKCLWYWIWQASFPWHRISRRRLTRSLRLARILKFCENDSYRLIGEIPEAKISLGLGVFVVFCHSLGVHRMHANCNTYRLRFCRASYI